MPGSSTGRRRFAIWSACGTRCSCARAGGPYVVAREREANGGFYDLALSPRFDIAPQIAHAGLVELKYLKPGGRKPAKAALAALKAEAAQQLDRYSADSGLAKKWRLAASGGHVSLHRLVLVFKGGDCLLAEEA
ncbi:MAG: PD-(D/E)XK nuclease domain-containing protein [Kiritimatiellae bacterium]|nr:PD-(D/E)XK nuclease domain-containing protein [Kiritimatiellia bacterium]